METVCQWETSGPKYLNIFPIVKRFLTFFSFIHSVSLLAWKQDRIYMTNHDAFNKFEHLLFALVSFDFNIFQHFLFTLFSFVFFGFASKSFIGIIGFNMKAFPL